MFTGLVEGTGIIKAVRRISNDMTITVSPVFDMDDLKEGDSVAVDGVCLTVTDIVKNRFSMDISGETLLRSTLGKLKHGDEVNLERALLLTDRLGGHLVSGHVDGVGVILKKETKQRFFILRVEINEHLSRYSIEKGSIAVDGISLTINQCGDKFFEVNIIPQTARETTILRKTVGDMVNIEMDVISKYIEKFFLRRESAKNENINSGIDLEMLLKRGFIK
ncbi:MAG: riboflavin synthase [Deltaproteobacteria bacterium]|nr:riboflavin synthase [Deltaproteobacteria bacterium]